MSDHFIRKVSPRIKEELESLRASNAALKAELKRYADWVPSDPGTKEALRWADGDFSIYTKAAAMVQILSRSLRAAMVRLEEAEKVIAGFQSGDIQ